jgi:hypothetical protein
MNGPDRVMAVPLPARTGRKRKVGKLEGQKVGKLEARIAILTFQLSNLPTF